MPACVNRRSKAKDYKSSQVLFSLSMCLFCSQRPRVWFSSFIGCFYRILTHIYSQCGYFCSSTDSLLQSSETRLFALCEAGFKLKSLDYHCTGLVEGRWCVTDHMWSIGPYNHGQRSERIKTQRIMGEKSTEVYSQRQHAAKTKQWVFYLQLCLGLNMFALLQIGKNGASFYFSE